MKVLIIVGISLGLLACNHLSRHPESGYSQYKNPQHRYSSPAYRDSKGKHRGKRAQELNRLSELEASLSHREKEQYYNYQQYFKSTKDKIRFLEKPNLAARDRYMKRRVFQNRKPKYKRSHLKLIERRDIAVGMTKDEIQQSWGEPDHRAYAGDPMFENEKWSYSKRLKTVNGYQDQTRHVIFEAGRVAGWKTN